MSETEKRVARRSAEVKVNEKEFRLAYAMMLSAESLIIMGADLDRNEVYDMDGDVLHFTATVDGSNYKARIRSHYQPIMQTEDRPTVVVADYDPLIDWDFEKGEKEGLSHLLVVDCHFGDAYSKSNEFVRPRQFATEKRQQVWAYSDEAFDVRQFLED